MPTTHVLIGFALVSATLMVVPGPSNFFIVAHGVGQGRRPTVTAVAGIETAAAIRVLLTAAGLSAVIAASALVFGAIRWAGVVYLLYLAARAVRRRHAETAGDAQRSDGSPWRSFRAGFAVGLGNPKTLLFFIAFFPQFVQPGRGPAATQLLILGILYVAIATTWDLGLAVASGTVGRWVSRRPRVQLFSGCAEAIAYVGLAAYTAVAGGRSRH